MMTSDLNIGIEIKAIEKLQSVLSLHPEVKTAIVYGSRAKGNFKPFSDIDLTLVGPDLNLTVMQKIENEIDDLLLPYKMDLSIFHHIQNLELIEHIERVGKIFYESAN